MAEHNRDIYQKRLAALRQERASFRGHWSEIQEELLPRRGRFLLTTPNTGEKINGKIIDSTGTFALRTLAAGLMSGLTSPSRPWFRLTTEDLSLRDRPGVKVWLEQVQRLMEQIFATSNVYKALPALYEELGAFGTAAMMVLGDFNDVIRVQHFPVGSYMVANSPDGTVDTFYREFSMTVNQIVTKFGKDNVSNGVVSMYDKGSTEKWIELVHLIEPNDDRIEGAVNARDKAFRSVWYEKSSKIPEFLRQSGFDDFPIMAPRWWLNGEDVYGRSPAMDALGDVKQLQHHQKRKAQALDKIISPSFNVASQSKKLNLMPAGVNAVDTATARGSGIWPTHEVRPEVLTIRDDILEVQQRIKQHFHADLFLMLSQLDRRQITAREVEERHEEKLLQLGPVLERVEDELLDPLIDRTFNQMLLHGLVPDPPPELEGVKLRVEYISILAQAQRSVGVASMDRLVIGVGQLAGLNPEVVDKIDPDRFADEYGDALGTPPTVLRSDEAVAAVREKRAQRERAAARLAAAQQGADTAKTASETSLEGDTLLARLRELAASGELAGLANQLPQ